MTIEARFSLKRGQFNLDVDLSLPTDRVTAIYGASGSGKTSLLRAIAGLDKHDGTLVVDGMVWQDETTFLATHQRDLAYVFQEASLFDHLTVQGNFEYALKRAADTPLRQRFSLDDFIQMINVGHLLERKVTTLSGGERQRVAIVRALASYPKLLLMDEPLASLDDRNKQSILPYLSLLHEQLAIPILYVSHVVEEVAQLADNMVLLGHGSQVIVGNVQEMLTRLDLSMAKEANAGAVISAEVSSHDLMFGLTYLRFANQTISIITQPNVAELSKGNKVRLYIAAKDVSIVLEPPTNTSILNVFKASVDELVFDGQALATVRVLIEQIPLLVKLTRKSLQKLGLERGKVVYIQAKSVALVGS